MAATSIFTEVINSYLPEPHASLLNGIIFGVPLKSNKEFILELKKVGLTHLVVLSGMNITILASMIAVITRRFSKQLSILITILSIIIFVIFVGIQAPIVRAAFMGILTLVSVLLGKKSTTLFILLLSAIISIIICPEWLTSISFHLSYAATLGLILFNKSSSDEAQNSVDGVFKNIVAELQTSLSAQLFTVPIIFINFKQISLIAPLSNLAVSWVVTPIMIFGFMTAILGKLSYELGLIPSYISYVLLSYVILIVHFLSLIPYSFFSFNGS
jgi:competence protein ComEC